MTILRWLGPFGRMDGAVSGDAPSKPGLAEPKPSVEAIHAEHADFVWKTLQRLGVPEADLEDLLQEVFIVVHRKLASFDGSARMTTWLFAISLRVAAARSRRAHVRRERPGVDLGEFATTDGHDPETDAIDREARATLERLLSSLSLEKRATLVMFEVEGLSAPEIAAMTGVPVGTVYSRLSSARVELTRAVERESLRATRRRAAP